MMGDNGEWFRWLGTIAVGIVSAVAGWLVLETRELRRMLINSRETADASLEKAEERWRESIKDVVAQFQHNMEASTQRLEARMQRSDERQDEFRRMIEEDRKLASADRTNIASTMLTRAEFDRQMDRRFPERSRAL